MKKILFIFYLSFSFAAFSQQTTQDLQKVLKNAKHDTTRLECYAQIAFLCTYSNLDSAKAYLQKAEKLSRSFPKTLANFSFLNAYGSYYATINNNAKAIDYYQQAKDLAYSLNNDPKKKTSSFNLISCKYIDMGNYAQAIKALFEFKALLDSTKETKKYYYHAVYGNLSGCYSVLNDVKNAELFALKMLDYSATPNDTLEHYKWLFEALCKNPMNNYSRLHKTYELGVRLASQTQNISTQLNFIDGMGVVSIKIRRFNEAIKYAQLIEELATENTFLKYRMYSKRIYGQARLGLKQYPQSIAYFEEAIPYFKKTDTKDILLQCLEGITMAYEAAENYQKAYQYQTEYSKLKEQILDKEKQKIAEELNVQYQTAEKEKKIVERDVTIKIQQDNVKKQQQQKSMILGLLGLTFLVALWALFNYRKKTKLSLALAREKAKVEQKSAALSELNSQKDRLLAIIGHDLRGPVSALHTTLREFSHDNSINIQQKVHALTGNVAGLYDTLNNVLQWAMVQMKGKTGHKTALILRDCIDDTLSLLNYAIVAKNISTLKQVPVDVIVQFNEQQLQCVLRNVLSNAIKFTPQGGFIRIYPQITNEGKVQLNIQDSGVGIENGRLQTILTKGQSTIGTLGEKGTGLGLKLCADLMKEQGGGIEMCSEVNKGTVVKIIFE
jgi:signal transduction histidine kinase